MRARFASEKFMREDYSIDLFAARLHLVKEIESAIGEVRDYNGGMILKQSENFQRLKKLLGKLANKHALLLQNFFHAIMPAHLSTTLDPHLLRILFSMLLEAQMGHLKSKRANDYLFVMIKSSEPISKQATPSNDLLTVEMQIQDSFYRGYIFLDPNLDRQNTFLLTFEENHSYLGRD
jgi:hypothetical protein